MARKRLIIVEDSAAVRRRIRAVAETVRGVLVVAEARTVDGALQAIHEHNPHILVLDMRLAGGTSGMRVLDFLRKLPAPPMVILLSVDADQLDSARTLFPEVRHVIDKVLALHRLPDLLADCVAEFPARNLIR